jgi:hypothetical protein
MLHQKLNQSTLIQIIKFFLKHITSNKTLQLMNINQKL